MIDKDQAEINAITLIFGEDIEIRICYFHVVQAVRRWIERRENHVPNELHARILVAFGDLKFARGVPTENTIYFLTCATAGGKGDLIAGYR